MSAINIASNASLNVLSGIHRPRSSKLRESVMGEIDLGVRFKTLHHRLAFKVDFDDPAHLTSNRASVLF